MIVSTPSSGHPWTDIWDERTSLYGMSMHSAEHICALADYFPILRTRQSDALIVETRRHLGGCLLSIETTFRLALVQARCFVDQVEALPSPLSWPVICAHPPLVGPQVLAHMRSRAAVTLILREQGQSLPDPATDTNILDIVEGCSQEAQELATILRLAEWNWISPGGEDQPLRADLPLVHFEDLLWTVVACVATRLREGGAEQSSVTLDLCHQAAENMLSNHEDVGGPFSTARRLVEAIGDRANDKMWLGWSLNQRRFPLFVALSAKHLSLSYDSLMSALIDGPIGNLTLMVKAMSNDVQDLGMLLLTLQPVRPAITDDILACEMERFDHVSDQMIADLLGILRMPRQLASKLQCLNRGVSVG